MQSRRFAFTLVLSLAAASAIAVGAEAQAACGHPAMATPAACQAASGIDPNTFLVQPPASTQWVVRATHANGEHPAVIIARQHRSGVDSNTFLVQPPVTVTWTVQEPAVMMAAAPRR